VFVYFDYFDFAANKLLEELTLGVVIVHTGGGTCYSLSRGRGRYVVGWGKGGEVKENRQS